MNNNAYQSQFSQPGAGAINPAVLAAFPPSKQKFPPAAPAPAVSPAQLINAQQHSAMSINPAQLMANQTLSQSPFPDLTPQQKAYAAQQARQQKMDEQRQAARMQILQQSMGMNMNMGMQPQQAFNNSPQQQHAMMNVGPSINMNMYPQDLARSPSAMAGGMFDRPSSSAGMQPSSQGGGGMMLPPSALPRGMNMNAGMSGMGGMGMGGANMNMMNMSGMRAPMRPPSRAMSSTPVNGAPGINGVRGMSPPHSSSTPMSNGPGPGPAYPSRQQGPYPPQQGQGQHLPQMPVPSLPQLPQTPQSQSQAQQQHLRSTPTPAPPLPVSAPAPVPAPAPAASPPIPGSPYRTTAKRKLTTEGSPRVPSAGMNMGMNAGVNAGMNMNSNMGMNMGPGMNAGMGMGMGMGPPQQQMQMQMNGGMPMTRPQSSMGFGTGAQGPQGLQGQQGQQGQQQQGQQGHQRQASVPRQPKAESGRSTPVPVSVPMAAGESQGAGDESVVEGVTGMSTAATASTPQSGSTASAQPSQAQQQTPTQQPPQAQPSTQQPQPQPQQQSQQPQPQAQAQPQPPALPPLPAHIHLPPSTTRITLVPLLTSPHTIPPLSPSEISSIKTWMEKDRAYENVYRTMRERMGREVAGRPRGWWEKGFVVPGVGGGGEGLGQGEGGAGARRRREVFEVRYPRRKGDRRRGKREGLRLPRKLDIRDVNKPEQLVPIRLEFDVEHHKMRDTFVWNLNDPVVTPEAFAQSVVEDYALSSNYHGVITKSIQDQLSDFRAHSGLGMGMGMGVFDPDGDVSGGAPVQMQVVVDLNEREAEAVRGRLGVGAGVGVGAGEGVGPGVGGDENENEDGSESEEKWWMQWRGRVGRAARGKGRGRSRSRPGKRGKRRRVEGEDEGVDGDVEDGDVEDEGWEKGKRLDEMEVDEAKMQEEMRILIRLDIIVGSMKLDDQFEWDLENEAVTPEEFAEVYVQDLGLHGEFKTAISHSIREQVQAYQKSLFLVGHPSDGSAVQDEDLRMSFLPSLTSAARPLDQVSSFTPTLNYLSDGEIDRNEKEREKDMNRRRKRNTRGRRGIALPDREPIRTYRTPAIGFPELDPATLALAAAANAPVSRRAAAAAASLTIANMVASENGTAFLPQVAMPATAVPPPQPVQKEKKSSSSAKGHFKAPSFPPEVLRPRAHVAAPTPSTAADVATLPAPLENDPPPPAVTSTVATISSAGGAGTGTQTPDSRAAKVITAKRAKELEREAKEKEFADGQHPNMIDGVWHCSNCGCPDSIAVGRRKGPLGDKSQCGVCGKYWHRHRRPRPVEYNPDPEYHSGLKREMEQSKAVASAKKKGGAAALRAQSSTHPHTPAETSEPQTPSRSNGDFDVSARPTPTPAGPEDDRAVSPVSTASSASEAPLAQRIKTNGARRITSPPAPETPVPASATASKPEPSPSKAPLGKDTKPAVGLSPMSPIRTAEPPQWLIAAKAAMMARYPNDKFETILRKVNAGSQPEWRIKCLDCPGKLYTPGPGETLANYEVHLKNRQHRQRVNDRLSNEAES